MNSTGLRFGAVQARRLVGGVMALFAAATVTLASAQTTATSDAADPPGRVGRLSYLSGPVQLVDARTGQAENATLNWPISSSSRIATGRLGRAEVRIGSTSVRVDGDSEVEFVRIDDEAMQLIVPHGSASLRVRNREHLREIDLLTPHERVVLDDVGRYRIDVDQVPGMTALTAWNGRARISNGQLTYAVASGQRGELESTTGSFRLVGASMDYFDDWVAARDTRDDSLRSARYVSPETTGIESLDDHGAWREFPEYGAVWFPTHVAPGWAPYRYGHWGWIAPWGWTWIDDAPWGFAPFHYGRWVVVGGVWGWVPGVVVARPVYAPALVAWFGGPGLSVSIGIGSPVGPIGWFPLGPREIYMPGYRCSRRHIDIVNTPHVVNITNITVINPPPRYLHQDRERSTWAPQNALRDRSPVQRVKLPPPDDLRNQLVASSPNVEPPQGIKKHPADPRRSNAEPRNGSVPDRESQREREFERRRGDAASRTPQPDARSFAPAPAARSAGDSGLSVPRRADERMQRGEGRDEDRRAGAQRRDERAAPRAEDRRSAVPRDEVPRDSETKARERRLLPQPADERREFGPRQNGDGPRRNERTEPRVLPERGEARSEAPRERAERRHVPAQPAPVAVPQAFVPPIHEAPRRAEHGERAERREQERRSHEQRPREPRPGANEREK